MVKRYTIGDFKGRPIVAICLDADVATLEAELAETRIGLQVQEKALARANEELSEVRGRLAKVVDAAKQEMRVQLNKWREDPESQGTLEEVFDRALAAARGTP